MLFTNINFYIKASTAMVRSYRNAALCTGQLYFMEEEKARSDFEAGHSGYWLNCQWVRSPGARSAYVEDGGVSPASDSASASTSFGTDCQPGDTASCSGVSEISESDSTTDTGLCHI